MSDTTRPARVLQLVADRGRDGAVAELVLDGLDQVDARLHVAGVLDDAELVLDRVALPFAA